MQGGNFLGSFGLQIWSWLMIIAGDFHFSQKLKKNLSIVHIVYIRENNHIQPLKSLLSKKIIKCACASCILRNFSSASYLHECLDEIRGFNAGQFFLVRKIPKERNCFVFVISGSISHLETFLWKYISK